MCTGWRIGEMHTDTEHLSKPKNTISFPGGEAFGVLQRFVGAFCA